MRSSHLLLVALIRATTASQPTVHLPSGPKIHGLFDTSHPNVHQYLGIPYARPPLGSLRFEPPLPNTLPTTFNASALGKSCTQFATTIPTAENLFAPEFVVADANESGEDCLTLSIWTPAGRTNATANTTTPQDNGGREGDDIGLPVLVFFYGGGWYSGGQNTKYQIPTQWVGRTQDLVVVVPNFRGNIFGYPNARGLKDQNLGLLDQRLALEWIRTNIAAFNGSPSKITIWGQSSGAEAVDFHSLAWPHDPIVSGLIMDSGTALIEDESGPRYSNFTYVAQQVGCGNVTDAKDEVECMKGVDARTIEKVVERNFDENGMHHGGDGEMGMVLAFGVAVDGRTVFRNYEGRVRRGEVAKVPAIIGINREDGNTLAPYNLTGPDPEICDMYFQMVFLCPSYQTSKIRASSNLTTYRYLYSGNFSNISPLPWMGAPHSAELPMLFGTHGNYRGPSSLYQIAVSEAMQDAWRAFANDPENGLVGQNWPRYAAENGVVRVFGEGEMGVVARNGLGVLGREEGRCGDGGM